jgi:hypothetical protein
MRPIHCGQRFQYCKIIRVASDRRTYTRKLFTQKQLHIHSHSVIYKINKNNYRIKPSIMQRYERKRSWSRERWLTIPPYAWSYWGKSWNISVRTGGHQAGIWNQDLQNTKQKCPPPGCEIRSAIVTDRQKLKDTKLECPPTAQHSYRDSWKADNWFKSWNGDTQTAW